MLCLKCEIEKELSCFSRAGRSISIVCNNCWNNFSTDEIINSVCIRQDNGCILWPDPSKEKGYYNNIRKNISKSNEYVHVRCNSRCLNKEHFFYFKKNSAPYWFKGGLNSEIDFCNPSTEEISYIKEILYGKVDVSNECWIQRKQSNKKTTIKFGKKKFLLKKLYYSIFVDQILSDKFAIYQSCGNENCLSPKHMKIFYGSPIPFWARKKLKQPKENTFYCENDHCEKYSIELGENFISKYNGRLLCLDCHKKIKKESKAKKFEYDQKYSEENREKINKRYSEWAKTERGRISVNASAHKRRDLWKRKLNTSFIMDLRNKYKTCCYCKRDESSIRKSDSIKKLLQVEHIIPLRSSVVPGTNEKDNIEIACWECNYMKKNLTTDMWLEKILKKVLTTKDVGKKNLYEKIIDTLNDENNFVDGKFTPRHLRGI